jgi:glycerophosphoryl diester phosphodiesterase
LKLAYELDILVNIELKSPTHNLPALIDCTLEQIIGLRLSEKVIISSFDHGMLSEIRKRNKTIALAALTEHPLKAPVSYLKKLKADACNLGCFHGYRNVGFKSSHGRRYLDHIAKLRKHYFDVNIWTCNNVDEMTDLVRHGVDGLISDFPNRVQQILNDKSILRA